MNSKAVALFLSLGLATTVAACGNAAPDGGEEGGSVVPTNPAPTAQGSQESEATATDSVKGMADPTTASQADATSQGGEEGGASATDSPSGMPDQQSSLPSSMTVAQAPDNSTLLASRDESGESGESHDYDGGEQGESGEQDD